MRLRVLGLDLLPSVPVHADYIYKISIVAESCHVMSVPTLSK
jgi:hypothetical protein